MEIRPFTPALAEDYFRLFDHAFADFPEWRGCFCAFYDDPCSGDDWDAEAVERNRGYRQAVIDRGGVHGLLAYDDGEPVGWVNAGPREAFGNLRQFGEVAATDDPPTGVVMCFVVHPGHRGRGVASQLLGAVDDHLRGLGMQRVEGYPPVTQPTAEDASTSGAHYYKGTPSMFDAAGYELVDERERFKVYRKAL